MPNRFKLDWIRNQYAGRIETVLLSELAGGPGAPGHHARPRECRRPRSTAAAGGAGFNVSAAPARGGRGGRRRSAAAARRRSAPRRPRARAAGSTRPTFDTLVPEGANQMARTAACTWPAPGQMYNPLFIYGGVGLGKTHLIHAVGTACCRSGPTRVHLYLHAEQFITDVVRNYQRKTFDELKAVPSLDLLLIDDVQFFAGKERTQEEFFNAFEACWPRSAHHHDQRHLSERGWKADIDERLTSALRLRPDGGHRAARAGNARGHPDAQGPSSADAGGRGLLRRQERARQRARAGRRAAQDPRLQRASARRRSTSIQLAREALKDLLSIQNRQIGVENIQKTVADFYKIKVADMCSKAPGLDRAAAPDRDVLVKEMTQKSLPEIGELFGGRDHTTVLHAVRKIAGERQKNSELNQQLHVLEQTLKGDDARGSSRDKSGDSSGTSAVVHSQAAARRVVRGGLFGPAAPHRVLPR